MKVKTLLFFNPNKLSQYTLTNKKYNKLTFLKSKKNKNSH